jgi:hypothetical protein
MIISTVTLTTGSLTVTLGEVTYTAGNAHGYTLDKSDLSPAPRQVRQQALPLVGGGVVTPGRPGIRVVELEGLVLGRTPAEANELAAALAACVADQGDAGYTVISYTPRDVELELTATLDGQVRFDGGKNSCAIRYQMRLVCPDPLAYSATIRDVTATTTPGTSFSVLGDATVWPDVQIVATGSATSVRVGNSTSGQFIQLDDLTLTAGNTVTIRTRPGYEQVLVNGTNGMAKRNAASRWFNFAPGENKFFATVLGGGGTVEVTATWRDGWAS